MPLLKSRSAMEVLNSSQVVRKSNWFEKLDLETGGHKGLEPFSHLFHEEYHGMSLEKQV